MEIVLAFLHLAVGGIIALFAPVNPIGTALVVNPLLEGLDQRQRHRAAAKITTYCLILCLSVIFVGSWLFKLFGISLPVVQLAGGILICRMGWQMLATQDGPLDAKASPMANHAGTDIEDLLFYPIAFPMTTGPGTMSVLLTLSAHGHASEESSYLANLAALVMAVLVTCLMVYLSFAYTPGFLKRLGPRGGLVVNRLSAFLVFCVGIEIATSGIGHLLQQYQLH
jgi:multiple antibiotic resistance protein